MIKLCIKCNKDNPSRYRLCKDYINERRNTAYRLNPIPVMLTTAKRRALRDHVPFTLRPSDLTVPSHCPILGLKLAVKQGKGNAPNSPSLDKINPSLGYVPGNVQIISSLANAMKQNATLTQIVQLGKWAEIQISKNKS